MILLAGLVIGWSQDPLPAALPLRGFEPVKTDRRLKAPPGKADEFRDQALARAMVWREPEPPVAVAALRRTRAVPPDMRFGDEVACKFQPQQMSGFTPKFDCVFENGEVLKVKYDDPEVHTEVAAARLLQSLGFGADHMYMIKTLRCFGCPKDPFPVLQCAFSPLEEVRRNCPQTERTKDGRLILDLDYAKFTDFTNVAVERRLEGKVIDGKSDEGWGWHELEEAQSSGRGATRAHRDALRLMAVFLNDWDNRSSNQRLVCLPAGYPSIESGACTEAFAYMHDLGASFGGRGGEGDRKLNVERWSRTRIWKDPTTCQVSIRNPFRNPLRAWFHKTTFRKVTISEPGRRFLAERIGQLSEQQVRDLFEGARLTEYPEASDASKDVENWVKTFDDKRREITERPPCPAT